MRARAALFGLVILYGGAQTAYAGHYQLLWFRQWDRSENGQAGGCGVFANHVFQVWVFDERGKRKGSVEVRDQNGNYFLGQYGDPLGPVTTRADGKRAEIPLFPTNPPVGVQCIDDEGSTSDISPVVTVAYGSCQPYYSYDVGFLYKEDPLTEGVADLDTYGVIPDATNGSDDNPYTKSMVYSHQYWPSYTADPEQTWDLGSNTAAWHAQTFVADNINRILGVFLFPVQPANGPTQWKAEIREGGPTGPLVCENQFYVTMFFAQPLAFARDACMVTPGQTYSVNLIPLDPTTCNIYAYPGTNYSNGMYYKAGVPQPDIDMFGFVWGWMDGYQTHGVLKGTIRNHDDAVVVGASVNMIDEATETVAHTYTTDVFGRYYAYSVLPGSYRVEASHPDYRTGMNSGNVVAADAVTEVDLVLDSIVSRADFDQDHDVDLTDYGFFLSCYAGPNAPIGPTCAEADFDGDGDADLTDYGGFLGCYNGPASPPADGCTLWR
jgi:hypothetical protein